MTGFQQSSQKGVTGKNFVVPFKKGKVVARSIQLSNPLKKTAAGSGLPSSLTSTSSLAHPRRHGSRSLRPIKKGARYPPAKA